MRDNHLNGSQGCPPGPEHDRCRAGLEPIIFHVYPNGRGFETATDLQALAAGQERQAHAQANEDAGWQDFMKWGDVVRLRRIAAISQTVFPGPRDDALASA